MSDLLVTGHTPILGTGRAMRVFGVMAALARSGPLEVAYVPFDGPEPDPAVAAIPGITLRPIGTSRAPMGSLGSAPEGSIVSQIATSQRRSKDSSFIEERSS